MKKCENCDNEAKFKFCSRACSIKSYRIKNREKINQAGRDRLKNNPDKERAKRAKAAREWRKTHPDGSRKHNRSRIGTGEDGTPETVLFYGYKEPLRKYDGGFGYQGVLSYSKTHDKVQCHMCGKLFRSLNNGHLMQVHGVTAYEYKESTGLSQQTALVGEGARLKLIERGHNPNHMVELKKAQEKRRERIKKGLKDTQSGKKMSLEVKNKRGTCPDQLLAIIDRTIKSYGRVPTEEEFLSFQNGRYMGSIRRTYGTWTNALSKLGQHPNMVRYSENDLLDAMRNFYQVNNRTPRFSDMERGLLPSASAYYSKFKSINNARLKAGLPLVIKVGHRKSEEWMPTPEERERMISKI
jgi:hypothetical protein